MRCLLPLLLLPLLLCATCTAVYFHMAEAESRCFTEMVAESITMSIKYKVEVLDSEQQKFAAAEHQGFGLHAEVTGPDGKLVLSRTYGGSGRIAFTAHAGGDHTVCLHSNSSSWRSATRLRLHLYFHSGSVGANFEAEQYSKNFYEIEAQANRLLDRVNLISRDQDSHKTIEERFRELSHSISSLVLWWSLGQVCCLLLAGMMQARHLTVFFREKKLV